MLQRIPDDFVSDLATQNFLAISKEEKRKKTYQQCIFR